MTQTMKTAPKSLPLFVVDTPPFFHRNYTLQGMMRDTFIALVPAMALAVYTYGLPALRVMLLAMGTSVLAEAVWERLLGRPLRVWDGTALISGLLFAFLLPAGAPWWLVVVGSVFMIIIGREVFGGHGANPLCPPLVGWAAMTVAWPVYMDPTAMNLMSSLTDPLLKLKYFGAASLPEGCELSLFMGQQLGGLGSSQIAAVLVGGIFLVLRCGARWEVPFFFLLSVFFFGLFFWYFNVPLGIDPAKTPAPHLYLLTGSTVFVAFFLATEYSSSPASIPGLFLYGLIGGLMVVLIRIFGIYPDGAPFAVLVASLGSPLYDLIRPKPFGMKKR